MKDKKVKRGNSAITKSAAREAWAATKSNPKEGEKAPGKQLAMKALDVGSSEGSDDGVKKLQRYRPGTISLHGFWRIKHLLSY